MTEQLSELGQAALEYVHAGFGVFPLHAGKKTPMTKHGFKDWTDDPDSVCNVWGKYPNANIGIACGEPSGNIVVIDVDKDDDAGYDGADTLAEWESEHGKLPETACAVTGRGGVHYYYRTDGRELHIDSNPDMHIDVRTDGGFVMAPPSVHPNGNAMYWDLHYEDYPIADADDNVYALIEAIYDHGKPDDADFKKVDASSYTKGGRNNKLFKMACGLMAQSWDDDAIIASIETYNAMSKNPLPDHEVKKLLKSALSKPKGKSAEWYAQHVDGVTDDGGVKMRGRPRKFDHVKVGDKLISDYNACMIDGMPAVQNGKVYELGWRAVNRAIIEVQKDATRANQMEVHHYLRNVAPEISQSPPKLIAFENGVLNIETMELLPFTPDMVIPNIIPHAWNPDAKCEAVDRVFDNISCGDIGMMLNLTEVIGLAMYRSCKFALCPILLGEGSNGKSTYIDMVRKVIGKHNVSALHPRDIGKRFQAGQLVGKLANLGDDISNEYVDGDACASIKAIAAGNEIYTDVKGGDGFTFSPYCLSVFSANKFPRLADTSYGMMRRLFPMGFHADFKASKADFDVNIIDKVTSKEALEYLCVAAVEGLRRVIEQNGMTANEESKQINRTVKLDNSTVLQWVDACEIRPQDVCGRTSNDVHEEYSRWCREHNLKPVGPRGMSSTFKSEWNIKLEHLEHFMIDGKRTARRVFDFSD